jgi:hypothetical protein
MLEQIMNDYSFIPKEEYLQSYLQYEDLKNGYSKISRNALKQLRKLVSNSHKKGLFDDITYKRYNKKFTKLALTLYLRFLEAKTVGTQEVIQMSFTD